MTTAEEQAKHAFQERIQRIAQKANEDRRREAERLAKQAQRDAQKNRGQ